jgi:SAM-dependent methyltransferase
MGLDDVRKVYERLGREDPMYAVLTSDRHRGNRWDPEEFFEIGRAEIRRLLAYIESLGRKLDRRSALDFGCGVGRLTQALAEHFDEVVGVDIADTMVEAAVKYDRHRGRVRYIVNTTADLAVLGSDEFDLVYSNITLQHVPPLAAEAYIAEFLRVVRPGGLVIFQMRNGPAIRPGSLRARLYSLRRERLRRFWKRVRGRPAYEMHFLARSSVEEVVAVAGGRVVDVVDVSKGGDGGSLRYCCTKVQEYRST